MNHHALTLLVLHLNHMLDTGKYDRITVEEAAGHVDDGSVLRWLRDIGKGDMDLSIHFAGTYGDFEDWYVGSIQALYDAYGAGSKWGVKNRGICMLLAYTNELLQLGKGWTPPELARRG